LSVTAPYLDAVSSLLHMKMHLPEMDIMKIVYNWLVPAYGINE
jgi:hypothetical protein